MAERIAGPAGAVLMQISNEMVRLFKDQFGRGPKSARAVWSGPDAIAGSDQPSRADASIGR